GMGVVAAGLAGLRLLQAFDLSQVEGERLFVAGVAATAAYMALSRGPWPGPSTGMALTALALPVAGWALVLSQTRNAWVGAFVGLGVVLLLVTPRALLLLPG